VGTPPTIREIRGGGSNDRKSYWFRTYGHKELEKIIKPFYQFNSELNKLIKVVPKDIDQWLNAQVLAYWFMDDGSITKKTLYLNTQSFGGSIFRSIDPTYEEQLLLQKALLGLNIKSSIKKDKISNGKVLYRIEIDKESTNNFIEQVKPYVLPIFHYKLGTK
jgi:hypothetical protein